MGPILLVDAFDALPPIAKEMASIITLVLMLTELLGHKRPGRKPLIAVGLGVGLAMMARLLGYLTSLPQLPADSWPGLYYLSAAFAGGACTLAAKLTMDGVINPVLKWKYGVAKLAPLSAETADLEPAPQGTIQPPVDPTKAGD